MLRTLLFATALLTASGTALAHNDYMYGRVVSVEPSISVSFGTGYYDGFRVLYESGGSRYWTHTPYRPGPTIVLPPRHRVQHVHHYRDYGRGWDDHRDGWRDDRREHHREQRRHGRD
jgi:hypothetical protein